MTEQQLHGLLRSARQVIENAISGVENLPGGSDAERYLAAEWLPYANSYLAALPLSFGEEEDDG